MLQKVVSGGQTGVDRAALDVALQLGIPHGGWVPKGRRAEDGTVATKYLLSETDELDYSVRTERNVQDSEATLIVSQGPLTGGSALTRKFAYRHNRPFLHLDLDRLNFEEAAKQLDLWLSEVSPETLNIAGPRESTTPGIYRVTFDFLHEFFRSASISQ